MKKRSKRSRSSTRSKGSSTSWSRRLLKLLGLLVILLLAVGAAGWWYFHPAFKTSPRMEYTQRRGQPLSLQVFTPEKPSGAGVLMMVSGAWKSDSDKFQPWMASSFLRQGISVVAVSHLSQPKASIMEICEDVQRAARFIRFHARDYGLDPQRIGVIGGSSGGHLSLMLATRDGPGDPRSNDPVDREDSSVQAAAAFYPVTDLLNLGPSTENLRDGGPPKSFRNAFGPQGTNLAVWKNIGRDVSPIYHITPRMPPVYIIHGDADTLVPLEQSQRFQEAAAAQHCDVQLLVRPGKAHGWYTMLWDAHLFALWMKEKLG